MAAILIKNADVITLDKKRKRVARHGYHHLGGTDTDRGILPGGLLASRDY